MIEPLDDRRLEIRTQGERIGPDRRSKDSSSSFPIRRRADDDRLLSKIDPYLKLSENLAALALEMKFTTIVISHELTYLTERVRHYFPKPRIIYSSDINEMMGGKILCLLNLACRRKHETYSTLTFREYGSKSPLPREPLFTLNFLSRNLPPGSEVVFVSLGEFQRIDVARKFLLTQKFANVSFTNSHTATAQKRPLLDVIFGRDRFRLREIQDPDLIRASLDFTKKCFADDFNYDERIDGLFASHSDYFIVQRRDSHSIAAIARHTWQLPNHFMPLMLATKQRSRYHVQIEKPDDCSYGEVMVVYEKNHSGAVAYREVIKTLFEFLISSGLDVVFTTYLEHRKHEGDFYAKTYGMISTGVTLEYGDFGGKWALVYGAKDGVQKNMAGKFGAAKLDLV